MRNTVLQEDRARNRSRIEELRRMSCAETERAQQLRSDELYTQKEDNKSQLLAGPYLWIQEELRSELVRWKETFRILQYRQHDFP